MARKKKPNVRPPASRPPAVQPRSLGEVEEKIVALDDPPEEEILDSVPEPPTDQQRMDVYLKALAINSSNEKRAKKLEERERQLDERELWVVETQEATASLKKELDARDAGIRKREEAAETGFWREADEILKKARARRDELLEQIAELEDSYQERVAEQQREWAERSEQLLQEIKGRQAEHEQRVAVEYGELTDSGAEQARRARELENRERALELRESRIDSMVEQRAADRVEELESRIATLAARLESSKTHAEELREALEERERAARRLGDRSEEQVADELDRLQDEVERLQAELARRPERDQSEEIEQLRRTIDAQEEELAEHRRQRTEMQIAASRRTVAEVEIQVLTDERDALRAARDGLRASVEEQRALWGELVANQESRTPFQQMAAVDEREELQAAPERQDCPDLATFVEDLRQRIAFDPAEPSRRLYYSPRELRLFLGGLAMSRLVLLEGISGTGKTSLPVSVARVLGGPAHVVEVQAGWRDRQDLLGHYNTFERRYDETAFVQALYQAQSRACDDSCFFVVLDEMNLSHPEQYFADVLSALEQQDPTLTLTSAAIGQAPRGLVDGRILKIPRNVWFVGTANQDETTVRFADKTYDRSHVQRLPHRHETFRVEKRDWRPPIAFSSLRERFDEAAEAHEREAEKALEFLRGELVDRLDETFEVGWGNRIDEQVRRFVPVVIATGGTLGEALDHLLATKILRKLRDRFGINAKDLEELGDLIATDWPDPARGPEGSLAELVSQAKQAGRAL